MGIASVISKIFELIFLLLFISIILTWFPKINWYNQPFKFLREFSEIFLSPFRKFIPPINGLDFSPIVAFICLSFIAKIIVNVLIAVGL